MQRFSVGPGNGSDTDQILRIEQHIFGGRAWDQKTLNQFMSLDRHLVAPDDIAIGKAGKTPTDLYVARTHSGEVLGYLMFALRPDHIHIKRIGVHPNYRARGVATALIERIFSDPRWRDGDRAKIVIRVPYKKEGMLERLRQLQFRATDLNNGYYEFAYHREAAQQVVAHRVAYGNHTQPGKIPKLPAAEVDRLMIIHVTWSASSGPSNDHDFDSKKGK